MVITKALKKNPFREKSKSSDELRTFFGSSSPKEALLLALPDTKRMI